MPRAPKGLFLSGSEHGSIAEARAASAAPHPGLHRAASAPHQRADGVSTSPPAEPAGALLRGDNLEVLRERVPDRSVHLVYLDPPFNSNRAYEATKRTGGRAASGAVARAHHLAFEDAWRWSDDATAAMNEIQGKTGLILRALFAALGPSDLLAYLVMMAPRLAEIARVLAPNGSVYVHCDPTASHYLKMLLDVIFGPESFQNEIVWRYRRWPARARRFQRMHDVLLFYTKGPEHTFRTLYGYEKLAESTLKTFGTKRQIADFSAGYRKPGRTDEETAGPPLSDVWEVGVIAASGKERTGYPTQKPEALVERVILASSLPGDVVLDPFCGSGTTLAVAARLGRRWIGIDASPIAIDITRDRLEKEASRAPAPGAAARDHAA